MQKAGSIPLTCYFPDPDSSIDHNPRQEDQHGITDARAFAEKRKRLTIKPPVSPRLLLVWIRVKMLIYPFHQGPAQQFDGPVAQLVPTRY